jgi:ribonuclease D
MNNLLICKTSEQINLFLSELKEFNKQKNICGIDFEFHNHKVVLCQIALYYSDKINMFIISPKIFNYKQTNKLIKYLFCSSNLTKIMHGSESQDMPFILNLLKNPKDINKFIKNLIDTKFLCEYQKILNHSYKSDLPVDYKNVKCSLYDALLFYKVINQGVYDNLEKDYKKLGPIQYVNWNINGLTNDSLKTKYAILDVFFLLDLYKNIKKEIEKDIKTNLSINRFNNITRFVILSRHKQQIIDPDINNLKLNNIDKFGKLAISQISYFRNILKI